MKLAKYTDFPEMDTPHRVSQRTIYDHEHSRAMVISLGPGQALKLHEAPVDVFFYVLEGFGKAQIGKEMVDVSKDMIIESPAKVAHRLCNETSPEFRVLVVQVPRPTEKGKLL